MNSNRIKRPTILQRCLDSGIIIIVILIVFVPLLLLQEFGQWRIAAALEHIHAGEIEKGFAAFENAIEKSPDDVSLRLRHLIWLAEFNRYSELNEECDAASEIVRKQLTGVPQEMAISRIREFKISALIGLSEYKIAADELDDYELWMHALVTSIRKKPHKATSKKLESKSDLSNVSISSSLPKWQNTTRFRNFMAYFRALAYSPDVREEHWIEQALDDVQKTLVGENRARSFGFLADMYVAFEEFENAKKFYTKAIDGLSNDLDELTGEAKLDLCDAIADGIPIKRRSQTKVGRVLKQRRFLNSELAGLYLARAYALEKLDKYDLAKADQAEAKKINPTAKLNWKLRIENARSYSREQSPLIDTRGTVYWKMGKLESSLADLDLAILQVELCNRCDKTLLGTSLFSPPIIREGERIIYERRIDHSLAVMHYHRAQVFKKLGKPDLAFADEERVRELGFEPQGGLF